MSRVRQLMSKVMSGSVPTDTDRIKFPTQPKPSRVPERPRRQLTKFEIWAWSQVLSFQVGLTGLYVGLVYFGIASSISALPALAENAPEGYTAIWSLGLILGSAVAAIGSINRKATFERVEFAGSILVSLVVGSYAGVVTVVAYVLGDAGRIAGAAGFTALSIPLIIRTLWLASQVFRK